MPDFYDELAPLYHLIHQDWDASIRRQGEHLSSLIKTEWSKSSPVEMGTSHCARPRPIAVPLVKSSVDG
jgi:hypothetical protein